MKHLKPVMSVVAANLKVPWIVQQLANREDVRVEAHLQVGETTLNLTDMKVVTSGLSVNGQLRFTDLQRKVPGKNGFLLFEWGGVVVGLELDGASAGA